MSNHTYTSFNSPEYHKEVKETVDFLMEKIDAIDWDSGKQMYVETPEYIIRAKKENG